MSHYITLAVARFRFHALQAESVPDQPTLQELARAAAKTARSERLKPKFWFRADEGHSQVSVGWNAWEAAGAPLACNGSSRFLLQDQPYPIVHHLSHDAAAEPLSQGNGVTVNGVHLGEAMLPAAPENGVHLGEAMPPAVPYSAGQEDLHAVQTDTQRLASMQQHQQQQQPADDLNAEHAQLMDSHDMQQQLQPAAGWDAEHAQHSDTHHMHHPYQDSSAHDHLHQSNAASLLNETLPSQHHQQQPRDEPAQSNPLYQADGLRFQQHSSPPLAQQDFAWDFSAGDANSGSLSTDEHSEEPDGSENLAANLEDIHIVTSRADAARVAHLIAEQYTGRWFAVDTEV